MVNTFSTPSAESQAAQTINAVIEEHKDEQMTAGNFVAQVEDSLERSSPEIQAEAAELIDVYRSFSHDTMIATLENGVGGKYDGGVTISTATLVVGQKGIAETAKMAKEVRDHEEYHKKNDHLSPVIAGKSAETREGIIAVIGGVEFTDTSIHEAVTVEHTGTDFVSSEYKAWNADLHTASAHSGHSVEAIAEALNDRDLSTVDDQAPADQLALAA